MSKPVGFSNSSACPPPGALHARSVTAAISRSGLTGSDTRASRRRLSRSARKSVRSEYIHRGNSERHVIEILPWCPCVLCVDSNPLVTRSPQVLSRRGHLIGDLLSKG